MKIELREASGVTILSPKGKVTIAGGDVALREQMESLVHGGRRRILIDLSEVSSMDSSGLGELIACKKLADDHGAQVKLLDVNQKITKILTMTRLVGIFDILDDEPSAIASF